MDKKIAVRLAITSGPFLRVSMAYACLFICTRLAHSAVFNISDGDVAALKSAIVAANSNGQADTINLASAGSYTLTTIDNSVNGPNGLPVIANNVGGLDLTINGNGAILQRSPAGGTPAFRILQVGPGANLDCFDLTITNGMAEGGFPANAGAGVFVNQATLNLSSSVLSGHIGENGGAIFNNGGSVTLNGGAFLANTAGYGGAIFNNLGVVNASGTAFTQNSALGALNSNAPGFGGAIYSLGTNGTASLTLSGCTFDHNHTGAIGNGSGGGIFNDGYLGSAVATLTNCSFDTNFGSAVFGGAIGNDSGAVTMTGCTLLNNSGAAGGGVYNYEGTLEVRNSTFEHNESSIAANVIGSGRGGGIANFQGTVTLLNSTLRLNISGEQGAGLFNSGTATVTNADLLENTSAGPGAAIANVGNLTLTDSRLNFNQAGAGGGLYNTQSAALVRCTVNGNQGTPAGILNAGTLTVESSTLNGNTSTGIGGGIGTSGLPGSTSTTVRNSTLSNNNAMRGGGISNGATVFLVNSTISGNTGTERGGGLYNVGGSITVECSTFAANVSLLGGGIYNSNSGGGTAVVTIHNTVLEAGAQGANLTNVSGTFTSLGSNVCNDASSLLNHPTDHPFSFTELGPLQNNGGPTFTHALGSTSAAIDAGDDNVLDAPLGLTTDQRGAGFPRRKGAHVDSGAFEFGAMSPPVLSAVSRKLHGGTPFDIDLPFVGEVGIECRSGGASNDYQVVVSFANAVTYTGASVSFGAGSVVSSTGSGTNSITVNLTGMTSGQTSTITLGAVSDGVNTGDVSLLMAVLVGDTNGNGSVNAGDTVQTRSRSGQATDATNFRSDVNTDGFVNSGDTAVVRSRSGTALPP